MIFNDVEIGALRDFVGLMGSQEMGGQPLSMWRDRDGKVLRPRRTRAKAHIVDSAMMTALSARLAAPAEDRGLVAIALDHAGPPFSFGAIGDRHPHRRAALLASRHGLRKRFSQRTGS